MEIVVDTAQDITQLFKLISDKVKEYDKTAKCFLENYIFVSSVEGKVKKVVAECVSDYIIDRFENKIALDFIKPFELMKTDVTEILNLISKDKKLEDKRRAILEKEILKVAIKGHINVDGLLKFRLSDYKKELQFTVELLIDELSAKKSYDEFVSLMKYFTEIQSPVTDTVVLSENDGEYRLTDTSGNLINLKFDEEFADELMPLNLSGEDLLISNLMAAMPKRIIFKDVNTEKPIINTISRIFEGRITH